MTDHAELRRLAKAATPGPWVTDAQKNGAIFNIESESGDMCIAMSQENPAPTRLEINEQRRANAEWIAAANPKTILALLDEIDGLRSRLEIDERTPHDGIACRDETIKVLDEKCDRLKAENEAVLAANRDCIDWFNQIKTEYDECASTIPGVYYMDPPDGGDVSVPEQLRRMARDAARYRWLRERDLETIRQGGVFAGMTPENIVINQEDLDAAIDAALEGAAQ
ncbi:ead/Ea22-like family protein [Pseudomonas aeruginosa]